MWGIRNEKETWENIVFALKLSGDHYERYFRMENTGPQVDKWYQEGDGSGSSTWDFCRDCVVTLDTPLEDAPSIRDIHHPYTHGYNGDPLEGSVWSGLVDRPGDDDHMYQCAMEYCDNEGEYE